MLRSNLCSSSRNDAPLIWLAVGLGAVLLAWPSVAVIAIGIWWNANTISHNFIHRPFFRSRGANFLFSCYLSALLGFPQTWWRDRHLAHHAGKRPRMRISGTVAVECTVVLGVFTVMLRWNPGFFTVVYLPGYLAGLLLCAAQGYYEHARGVTSNYGRLYNLLCFNDGFHAEHHQYPGVRWWELPSRMLPNARTSRWPATLRWVEDLNLETLERIVLRSPYLQAIVLRSHLRAFEKLLRDLSQPAHVVIVGGGLFPRTALVCSELLPDARITILDASPESLAIAGRFLEDTEQVCRRYIPGELLDCDLAVIPLSFDGDRERIYRNPPARVTLIHDWIWRRRGQSRIVSAFLLKRLNLVVQ